MGLIGSRNSIVHIVTRLLVWRSGVQFPAEAWDFSVHLHVQTNFAAQPASSELGARFFPLGQNRRGVKWTTHHLVQRLRMSGAVLYFLICLHDLSVINTLLYAQSVIQLIQSESESVTCQMEAHGGAVVWGITLQTERSRVRFPMVSLT